MEDEVDDRLSFLGTVIKRSSNNPYPEINTRIKPTDKGLFYYFSSFIPDSYKCNLVYCLVYRVYRIPSSDNIFKDNLRTLKAKFPKNGFPSGFFNQIVNKFLEKQYAPKLVQYTVPKKTVTIALPYLGPLSTIIRRRVKKLISRFYPLVDLNIVFRRGKTIKTMFSYKDYFPMKCRSGVVYQIQCEHCGSGAAYVGKTLSMSAFTDQMDTSIRLQSLVHF